VADEDTSHRAEQPLLAKYEKFDEKKEEREVDGQDVE
jgi:hypothetical protein